MCTNSLPSLSNLFKRRAIASHMCQVCGQGDESVEHLFLLCPWTKPIWFGSSFQWICDDSNKGRNNFYFEHFEVDPSAVLRAAGEKVSWDGTRMFKYNSDAALVDSSHLCATSFIIFDDHGFILTGSVSKFWAFSPLIAEALALREAINACASLDLENVNFEYDCKLLINALLGTSVQWEIAPIVFDIRSLLAANNSFQVHWIPRSLNCPADWVARATLIGVLLPLWTSCPPVDLRRVVPLGRLGWFG
ncbi:reverse transcriptase [Senna tora]|uniref:Reverse transcriptase n=1 Tax=Senna tora TaxID=362788 RepID=A0A834XFG7_9FABA|nr:reverse transcriptase [Senna tora]